MENPNVTIARKTALTIIRNNPGQSQKDLRKMLLGAEAMAVAIYPEQAKEISKAIAEVFFYAFDIDSSVKSI